MRHALASMSTLLPQQERSPRTAGIPQETRTPPLPRPPIDPFQYGGERFLAASRLLQRIGPGQADADVDRSVPVALRAGIAAAVRLPVSLPRLRVSLSDSPAGRRLRAHFRHRMWGIPHTRLAQGVLTLPAEEGSYIRGRSRQAVRTSINKARAAGIVCRPLSGVETRRGVTEPLRARLPLVSEARDELLALPGDMWFAAFAISGEPVTIARVSVDTEWAVLKSFASIERPSRYLLHTELVETLVRMNVGYLAVDAPMAPLLEPNVQYWQRLLGYQVVNLSLEREPLA
jgi:hypothetical protein